MTSQLPEFDVLVEMARNDPERLEALRISLAEDIIRSAPNEQTRKRLEGLQFQVDMERRRARSPMAACIRISEMMCHSLKDLHQSMVAPKEVEAQKDARSAKVLPLLKF